MNILYPFVLLVNHALAQPPVEYLIGAGDRIEITVHGHDFGRSEFVVGASGDISFPYVGMVHVGEMSAFDAEHAIETALANGYLVDPNVTLQVAEHRSHRVDVLGAVGKPGIYYLEGPTTLRALVARAGGAQLDKSSGQIVVTRDAETMRFDLAGLQSQDGEFGLKRGDVVNVSQGSFVYLTGEVAKPGAITFTDGMTASQALIQAGGSSNLSRLSGSYVLRDGERISVNLRRVLKGKDSDFELKPGDRVVVPESAI